MPFMTRGSLQHGRDPSGLWFVLAWNDRRHGPHGAGACRALCVEAEFRHRGQPGHHARTYPLNRQGTAVATHPHACFSKGCSSTASCTPLQHLWGSKAHTQAHTHMHAHTHTHACTHTYKHKRVRILTGPHTHLHIHTRTHTNAQTHRHTHVHTNTRTHTRAHTCICTCMHTLRA